MNGSICATATSYSTSSSSSSSSYSSAASGSLRSTPSATTTTSSYVSNEKRLSQIFFDSLSFDLPSVPKECFLCCKPNRDDEGELSESSSLQRCNWCQKVFFCSEVDAWCYSRCNIVRADVVFRVTIAATTASNRNADRFGWRKLPLSTNKQRR